MKFRFLGFFLLGFFSIIESPAQEVQLDQVIQLAIKKNYDVLVLQKTSDITANDFHYAYGAFLPTLNVTGSRSRSENITHNETFAGVVADHTGVQFDNTNASAQMSWLLFDGTKMFATRKRLEELAILGEINVRNQLMNTTSLVISTYYNIVRQKQQLKAIYELMAVSDERVKLAEKKLQVGTGGKPELLQAKVDLNSQRTSLLAQLTLIQQLKDQMNGQVGMSLPDVYETTDTIPINLSLTMEEIIYGIENTNQAVVAAKKNVDVANLILKENRAGRYPTLNANGSYSYSNAENNLQVSPASQQVTRSQGLTYGAVLSIPILNGMNVNRLVEQAKLNINRTQLVYEQQLIIATVGVRNAYVNYDNAKKALIIQEENILLAKENVYIALEGFKRGITTALDLRTAQQSLADAYNQLIAARFLAKTSEVELLRLKGALLK